MDLNDLNSPDRIHEIRSAVLGKPFLKRFYTEVYQRYQRAIDATPKGGVIVELGSGGGFAKDVIPEIMTSDVVQYEGIDGIVDACAMPFADNSVRAIVMLNVFHHIPDVEAFLRECVRCLKPGGRVLIVDQHMGWISRPVLRYLHHEACDPNAKTWKFESTGPLSSANGALAWIVFQRDRREFERKFPSLKLVRYEPRAPVSYWMAGGLKKWSLVGESMYPLVTKFDDLLCRTIPDLGSFVDVELEKV